MRILINKSEVRGKIAAPSSKSYTIRALMCAALAEGQSRLFHPLHSDDTEAAFRVLGQVGISASGRQDPWRVEGGSLKAPQGDLYCGDSAATLRFMSALCSLVPGFCRLTAGESLSKRPVDTLVEALKMWGVDISSRGAFAPVEVKGGVLKGGCTEMRGDISSQYVSALLLAAPLAQNPCNIRLTTPLESRPYIAMTLDCLSRFGIRVGRSRSMLEYTILPQQYQPCDYTVEGDWSSASYLLGLGALGGEIEVDNLQSSSRQGDREIIDILETMGASVRISPASCKVSPGEMNSIGADMKNCIDLLPTVAVLAAFCQGKTFLAGISRARLKESDRVTAVCQGLERAGIKVEIKERILIITGGKPRPALIDSHGDHRIAMAFSLMGVAAGGITIEGAECVSKTFPGYWELRALGVKIDEQ